MSILDLLFPKFCLGCSREGAYLCQNCQKRIVTIKYQTCPACPIITTRGAWCPTHKKNQALAGIMSFGYYHDPILRESIHLLKYRRIDELATFLCALMAPHFQPLIPHSQVILMSVPLHPWRKRYRDFNQAALITEYLASSWKLAYLPNQLIRTRHRQPQAELSNKQRLVNVTKVFGWQGDNQIIRHKTIWLVDDVSTTGATLEAGAKVLKQNGAKSIWGLVLAKG